MGISFGNLIYGGGYAEGAKVITNGKPKLDGNIEHTDVSFASKMREQINWLNVNEPDIQAIVTSLTSKTVGVNLNVQVESPNTQFNQEAEALISDFSGFELVNGTEASVCDLTEKLHLSDYVRTLSDFVAIHGGCIIRHHFNPDWRIPYKIERLSVDMINVDKTTIRYDLDRPEETTINGIVRNRYGAITHIWLYSNIQKSKSVKVSYSDLTYYSEVWISIDQQTAVSKLTAILSRLDAATQYGIAELDAAIEEAKAGHYIESSAYNELMKIVGEEINRATMGVTGVSRITAAKDLVTPILKDLSNLGVKARGLTPIATGDKPIFNTSRRNTIYNDINANSEMKVSASQGMSDIGVYSKAADANYSSIKYTLETDQRTADIRFDSISNRVLFGIFARLLDVGVQIGRITERADYWKNPHKYRKFRYLRQNKIDTEPAKNALANKTNIEQGLKSKGQIVEETMGVPYETFLAKKHEQTLLEIDYEVQAELARRQAYQNAGIMPITNPNGGQ